MIRFKSLLVFAFLVACSVYAVAQQNIRHVTTADSIKVVAAIDNFVKVFSNLQWKEFTKCFADDATAFFPPSAKFPYRANNKKEIENIFTKVFENARQKKTSPPYLDIQPKDLKIQMTGTVAIVTFLLEDPDLLGRRTLIFRKEKTEWLIVHLHASGVPLN